MSFLKHLASYQKIMERLQYIGSITKIKELGEVKAEYIAIKISQTFLAILATLFRLA